MSIREKLSQIEVYLFSPPGSKVLTGEIINIEDTELANPYKEYGTDLMGRKFTILTEDGKIVQRRELVYQKEDFRLEEGDRIVCSSVEIGNAAHGPGLAPLAPVPPKFVPTSIHILNKR